MRLVAAVAEVESGNVHACIQEFAQHLFAPTLWSHCAEDLCLANNILVLSCIQNCIEPDLKGTREDRSHKVRASERGFATQAHPKK